MHEAHHGHRGVPDTADIRIEAWDPTRGGCLSEVVAALRDHIADTSEATTRRIVESEVAADADDEALLGVLDEVIYLLDTEDVLALDADVRPSPTGLCLRLAVVPVSELDLSAIPKAVTLNELTFRFDGRHWRAAATIDV